MSKSNDLYQDQIEAGEMLPGIMSCNPSNFTVGQLTEKVKILVAKIKELKSKGCGQDDCMWI